MSEKDKIDLRIVAAELTPEQLQAQQDAYDQWTAPSVEPVDFEAEKVAYFSRRQLTEEIADNPGHDFIF